MVKINVDVSKFAVTMLMWCAIGGTVISAAGMAELSGRLVLRELARIRNGG
jgi:hypothetical protein